MGEKLLVRWLSVSFILSTEPALSLSQTDVWEPTSGPGGGETTALLVSPSGYIYVAAVGGLVFRSTNNGENWVRASGGLPGSPITCFAAGLHGRIYAGWGKGVYRSSDDGNKWELLNDGPWHVSSVIVTRRGGIVTATSVGIYRSTDDGVTWIQQGLVPPSQIVQCEPRGLALDPSDVLYAGTACGVFRSTDNGESWQFTSLGIPSNLDVRSVAVGSSGTVFAATTSGLYYSSDKGTSWKPSPDSSVARGLSFVTVTSKRVVFVGVGQFLARSGDGGTTWRQLDVPAGISCFAVDSSDNLFVGSGTGVVRSTDEGLTWTAQNKGFTATSVSCLAVAPDGTVYAGTDAQGLFATRNHGLSWQQIESQAGTTEDPISSVFVKPNGDILVGPSQGILRSTDGGRRWQRPIPGLEGHKVTCFALDSLGNIYAGTYDGPVFRSTDNGDHWTQGSGGYMATPIVSIVVSPSGIIWALPYMPSINMSTDQGKTWQYPYANLPYRWVGMSIDKAGRLYAANEIDGVFRSDDGMNWKQINNGLNGLYMSALIVTTGGELFAAGWMPSVHSVWRSVNTGDEWTSYSNGLNGDDLIKSFAYGRDGYLYAGTYRRGVYRIQYLPLQPIPPPAPSEFRLLQNYPNPFNSRTTILYELPETSDVSLKIFNVLGQEVATVVNENLPAGRYQVEWNASGCAGGVYFYQLQAGNSVDTKKFILLR